jgi:hypothetical protein
MNLQAEGERILAEFKLNVEPVSGYRVHVVGMGEMPMDGCGFAACANCLRGFFGADARVQPHDTTTDDSVTVWALCKSCWQSRTPAERLPFYLALHLERPVAWIEVKAAVLAGR